MEVIRSSEIISYMLLFQRFCFDKIIHISRLFKDKIHVLAEIENK
jgi:hypothetical protein